jgi:DNA repair exonuclease SbcCD ATPase subunit
VWGGNAVILRIRLRNWRSYDDVTIDFDRPVVFFVAPNGVGKTSLVDGIRRCLLGFPKGRSAGRAVRAGADRAELCVDLVVGSIGTVTVTRTLTRTGRTTFAASAGNATLSEEELWQILSREWAADLALLDRLVFGDADLSRRAGEALPVREHLADLLGVTPLLGAVGELRTAKTAISNIVADLRVEAAGADATASEAEDTVMAAQREMDELVADRQVSQSRLRAAEGAGALAADWERFRVAAARHNAEVADVLADIGRLVRVDPSDPTASLEQARADADAALARSRQSAQDADLAAAKGASASELLAESDGVCPTCLRPLSDAERAAALHAHGDKVTAATTGSARASDDTARIEAHVLALNEFRRRLDRLQPPIPPEVVDPGSEAAIELNDARVADSQLAEQIGEVRARLDAHSETLATARQRQQDATALGSTARQELLLETTANAFEEIANRYLSERIEPLRRDIEHRWKLVFGSEGLVLDPNGGIRLNYGEVTLDPEDMSGGERAIAGVIVRILVAAAVTHIPTLWFDEPLEHLDPRRRASVARTLVQAAAAGTVRQVVATTYEEGIARRLAAAAPDLVGVVYAEQTPAEPAAG